MITTEDDVHKRKLIHKPQYLNWQSILIEICLPTSKYHHLPHQSSCQTSIQESAFFLEAILRKYCQTQKSKHTLNYFVVFKEKQKNWKHLECTYLGSVLKDIYIGIRYSARYLGGPRYILMRVYKYVYKYIHTLQLPFETKQEL